MKGKKGQEFKILLGIIILVVILLVIGYMIWKNNTSILSLLQQLPGWD